MSLVQINWRPDAAELRSFGIAMIVGFSLIGFWFLFAVWPIEEANPTVAFVCFVIGAVAGLLGVTGTKAALPVYWAWMGIAFIMGNIISRVLLALVFYGLFTPMGLFMRLIGRDKLQLAKPSAETYWVDVPPMPEKSRYERQF